MLLKVLPSELAPPEDRGMLFVVMSGPEGATLDIHGPQAAAREVDAVVRAANVDGDIVRANLRIPGGWGQTDMNQARGFMLLKPWDERERSAEQIAQSLREPLVQDPGRAACRWSRRAASSFAAAARRCRWCSAARSTPTSSSGATS